MVALGHTLTPFCSVCRQFFGFIPADVRVLQISSDDVRPIFSWPSCLSLVARQFPLYCLTRYSGVLHSQCVFRPYQTSFLNDELQFPQPGLPPDLFIYQFVFPRDSWQSSLDVFTPNLIHWLSVFGAMQMAQRKRRNGENNRTLTLTLTLFLTLNLTLNDHFRRCAICVAPFTTKWQQKKNVYTNKEKIA